MKIILMVAVGLLFFAGQTRGDSLTPPDPSTQVSYTVNSSDFSQLYSLAPTDFLVVEDLSFAGSDWLVPDGATGSWFLVGYGSGFNNSVHPLQTEFFPWNDPFTLGPTSVASLANFNNFLMIVESDPTDFSIATAEMPEPSTTPLLGFGLMALLALRTRKKIRDSRVS